MHQNELFSGDLPSAVLLFEAAAKQHPENPEVWLLLGKSQVFWFDQNYGILFCRVIDSLPQ